MIWTGTATLPSFRSVRVAVTTIWSRSLICVESPVSCAASSSGVADRKEINMYALVRIGEFVGASFTSVTKVLSRYCQERSAENTFTKKWQPFDRQSYRILTQIIIHKAQRKIPKKKLTKLSHFFRRIDIAVIGNLLLSRTFAFKIFYDAGTSLYPHPDHHLWTVLLFSSL